MIKAIKGTKDILPTDIPLWKYLEKIVHTKMEQFNYKEIRTPLFEETGLFSRSIGEATDIVSKEMYTFTDKGNTSLTLRPEMTASVVRAVIEHSLDKQQNLNKLYYISSMFRQERPQAGRLRQFNQFGVEALGSNEPSLDAEMIIIAYDILKALGLKSLSVNINTLGVPSSRKNYKNILKNFLSDKFELFSEESKKRFDKNILRLFDSKNERDQELLEKAPILIEHLDDESLNHFEKVKQILLNAKIPFTIDPKLVRGLDYYTNTAFEIVSQSVGSQSALCGGGRYNLLSEELGGNNIPAVGFAAGIERILLACQNENSIELLEEKIDCYVIRIDKNLEKEAYNFALKLRRAGIVTELDYAQRSIKAQMREANKMNAKYTLLIGGEEFEQKELVLKNMDNSEQKNYPINNIDEIITAIKSA